MQLMRTGSKGFTLVELITVMVLVSILAAYAVPRFASRSDFSAQAAQEQAISIIRQIQLGRMQSNVDTAAAEYQLLIAANCLGSVAGCNSTGNARLNRNDYLDITDNVSFSPLMTVNFNLLGEPTVLDEATVRAVTITITNATESVNVCINSEGYVYGC